MSTDLIATLSSNQLIPTVLDVFEASLNLHLTYPGGKVITPGIYLQKEDAANEPVISLSPVVEGAAIEGSYTLVLTDPDAPSREDPKFGQWRHWVLPGIKPNAPGPVILTKEAATPYIGPGPGPSTGLHRYTFLLFREPDTGYELSLDDVGGGHEREQRRRWDAREFAKRKGLTLVAANLFLVQT